MTTLTKIIVTTVVCLFLFSCNFDMNFGIKGNGNVTSIERNLSSDFTEIEISRGLDVYLTQSDTKSLTVQADENLHDIIKTEVKDGVLKIYAEDNISASASKKVMLNFNTITRLKASSGSDVISTNAITAERLDIVCSSGSQVELDITAQTIYCETSSGSDVELSGSTKEFYAEASSGSDIKAKNLDAEITDARASSGADITVFATKKLSVKSSSGGDISYYGNPELVEKNGVTSGTITKQ